MPVQDEPPPAIFDDTTSSLEQTDTSDTLVATAQTEPIGSELYPYAQAEPLFQRALAICQNTLPPVHPVVAQSLKNLGKLYLMQGKYAQAEPLFQRALAIYRQKFEPGHAYTAIVSRNYAILQRNTQQQGKATESGTIAQTL